MTYGNTLTHTLIVTAFLVSRKLFGSSTVFNPSVFIEVIYNIHNLCPYCCVRIVSKKVMFYVGEYFFSIQVVYNVESKKLFLIEVNHCGIQEIIFY